MTRRQLIQSATALALLPSQKIIAAQTALPKLPFALDALEPYIDARTMEIHHGKHHQAYVDNLNKALGTQPAIAAKPVEQLLKDLASVPDPIRNAVRNNGGGHLNHSLFWQTLGKHKPGAAPKGKLAAAIQKSFGGQAAFEEKLRATGLTVFGSGWVWVTAKAGALTIETSPNQDSPWMAGVTPVFGIDVWEHAYYLKYQNRRADYLAAILNVIEWDFVSQRYEEITK
ncbi:MAG: superoxide dismutase [Bryobacteraceae bacterium]